LISNSEKTSIKINNIANKKSASPYTKGGRFCAFTDFVRKTDNFFTNFPKDDIKHLA